MDKTSASETLKELTKYPIMLTRDVEKAKRWLKERARGNERYGIIVSSQAYRLRPLAIDVRVKPDPVPFDCVYACEVKVSDCAKIEKALHKAFAPNRINANREFFRIDATQATPILELFDRKDITSEVTAEIENE